MPSAKEVKILLYFLKNGDQCDFNNTSYNRINLGNPIISSKIGDNRKQIVDSDFFSVNAILSHGISANACNEAEHLYNLLCSKKDAIDRILESQSVYALGPIFHENNTFPSVACWGVESLSQSTLYNLEELLNHRIIFHQIIENCESKSSNSGNNETAEGSKSNYKNDDRSRGGDIHDSGRGGDDSGRSDGNCDKGSDEGGNDGENGSGSGADEGNGKKEIVVSSSAFAESEDHDNVQHFFINARLHVKINESSEYKLPRFFISIDLYLCETDRMLSDTWKALSNEGLGYYLESVKIIISPINNDPTYRLSLVSREKAFPREKNNHVKFLENTEKGGSVEIGVSPKVRFQMKKSNNTKGLSNEWKLNTEGGCADMLFSWLYSKNSNNFKKCLEPGLHENIMTPFWKEKPPKLIKSPQISHNLEMTFNDLKDFDKKFSDLSSVVAQTLPCPKSNLGIPYIRNLTMSQTNPVLNGSLRRLKHLKFTSFVWDMENAFTVNSIPNESTNKESEIIDVKRSVIQDN
ncbi:hypothetical protein C1645_821781 [Glomus cerebriforme]|uniref:MACPF domain-containing protein n=1 Tax=Glomus cerebriforme TaxID=658196 RepID=A0A397SZY7_9GLOM|nr:hypothetical protein C1645_821781 [Glomus cerebriforme]